GHVEGADQLRPALVGHVEAEEDLAVLDDDDIRVCTGVAAVHEAAIGDRLGVAQIADPHGEDAAVTVLPSPALARLARAADDAFGDRSEVETAFANEPLEQGVCRHPDVVTGLP